MMRKLILIFGFQLLFLISRIFFASDVEQSTHQDELHEIILSRPVVTDSFANMMLHVTSSAIIRSEHIERYTLVDHQNNSIVHFLLSNIISRLKSRTLDDISHIQDDVSLLNKLSSHFALFKDLKNSAGQRPFDILFLHPSNMALAGKIANFKALLPTQNVIIENQSLQREEKIKKATVLVPKFNQPKQIHQDPIASYFQRNTITSTSSLIPPSVAKKRRGLLVAYDLQANSPSQ